MLPKLLFKFCQSNRPHPYLNIFLKSTLHLSELHVERDLSEFRGLFEVVERTRLKIDDAQKIVGRSFAILTTRYAFFHSAECPLNFRLENA